MRIEPRRAGHPQEHASVGMGPREAGRHPGGEALFHDPAALAVDRPDAFDMGVAAVVRQVAVDDDLVEARCVEVRRLLRHDHPLPHVARRRGPSRPDTGVMTFEKVLRLTTRPSSSHVLSGGRDAPRRRE